jgi:anti-sigma-K factor RskA
VNIKEYISSGIIESYVLGLVSEEEKAEFEQLCRQYPELVAARNSFELSLEKQSFANASDPPGFVKEGFLNFIIKQNTVPETTKVIDLENPGYRKAPGFKWLAAASILLLVVSGYLAYKFYNETLTLKSELQTTRDAQAQTDERLKRLEDQQKVIKDPNVSVVNLTGMPKAPAASASIYWDSTSSNVWLLVKNLPQLSSNKQYQLWALIDGKPKDLGLFDPQGETKVMLKMNNTQKADAFAITIENRGNTGGPSLDQLQTLGKTKL